MKTSFRPLTCMLVLAGSLPALAPAAQPENEEQLIRTLQSSASPAEKDAACARLNRIGTTHSVPALAALLTDEQLSHSARFALESMNFQAAGQALVNALDKTSGTLQAGILNSLAVRRESWTVPAVARLLKSPDAGVATAAAHALGEIGGPAALKALAIGAGQSSGPLHQAAVDGQLRCAAQLVAAGDNAKAHAVYKRLFEKETVVAVRVAAYRGLVLASGKEGLALAVRAIEGPPGPAQIAAMQLVSVLQAPEATQTLVRLLPRLSPSLQIALTDGLVQRGDTAAAAALAAFCGKAAPEVRVAVIRALGSLGDASAVPLLLGFAAAGDAASQRAAREALLDLRRGNVTDALLSQLGTTGPAEQAEAARALGARSATAALSKLVDLARQGTEPARESALKALAVLVDQPQLNALVRLVMDAQTPAARDQAAEALNTACQHIKSRHGRLDPQPLIAGLTTGSADARIALLPVCGGIPAPETRAALRGSLEDPNPAVREAAVRALCDTTDVELLDDLVSLAKLTKEDKFRMLAIAAVVRLTTEERARLANNRRTAALRELLTGPAERPEQKRLVLAGLGEVPDVAALAAVEPMLAEPAVQTEAVLAAVKIASALQGAEARRGDEVLRKALDGATSDATRQALNTVLKQLDLKSDYLGDWQIAGPYRLEGKDYAALFDTIFPPETSAAGNVRWRHLSAGTDPAQPCAVDLLKALGGTQCVAYARTSVQCDQDQAAELELGSDDGIKVWLNGNQVFALNTARPLQPGSDKVNVQLRSGWNQLLFKITQNNQGWGFCARLRKPDGSRLDGIRCEALPDSATH